MNTHTFLNILLANAMIWMFIDYVPSHYIIFYWIVSRMISRLIKHIYNIYINMGMRFELIWLDYFRFTSFYLFLPLEAILSYALLYCIFPEIKKNSPVLYRYNEDIHIDYILFVFDFSKIYQPKKTI